MRRDIKALVTKTRYTVWSGSVIKMGVVYVAVVCILKCSKEQMAWAIY